MNYGNCQSAKVTLNDPLGAQITATHLTDITDATNGVVTVSNSIQVVGSASEISCSCWQFHEGYPR